MKRINIAIVLAMVISLPALGSPRGGLYFSPPAGTNTTYYIEKRNGTYYFGTASVQPSAVLKYCWQLPPNSTIAFYCWANTPDAIGGIPTKPLQVRPWIAGIYDDNSLLHLSGESCRINLKVHVTMYGKPTAMASAYGNSTWTQTSISSTGEGNPTEFYQISNNCLDSLANMENTIVNGLTWRSSWSSNSWVDAKICSSLNIVPMGGAGGSNITVWNNVCESLPIDGSGNTPLPDPVVCTAELTDSLVPFSLDSDDKKELETELTYTCNKVATTNVGILGDNQTPEAALLNLGTGVTASLCVMDAKNSKCASSSAQNTANGTYKIKVAASTIKAKAGEYQKSAVVLFSVQ